MAQASRSYTILCTTVQIALAVALVIAVAALCKWWL
jgi:hypothetical protein